MLPKPKSKIYTPPSPQQVTLLLSKWEMTNEVAARLTGYHRQDHISRFKTGFCVMQFAPLYVLANVAEDIQLDPVKWREQLIALGSDYPHILADDPYPHRAGYQTRADIKRNTGS